jgi:hypothetical protein
MRIAWVNSEPGTGTGKGPAIAMASYTWHKKAGAARAAGLGLSTLAVAVIVAVAVAGQSLAASAGRPAHRATAARAAGATTAAREADGPSGFWYGTDSNYIAIPGPAPYKEPAIGSSYGGYVGMIGNWANWQRCGDFVVWSKTDSKDAAANYARHLGVGVAAYWFMAGPGVDPHYNGRLKEAYAWGEAQAAEALQDLAKQTSPKVNYPVVWMDVELPGNAPGYSPATDNGWNNVYTSPCSGVVRKQGIPASVDRSVFNGFAEYLTTHSSYDAGVYSAPSIWEDIFGTGIAASIPDTYEWTYTGDTSSLANPAYGWCLSGTSTCADFFGGITESSKYALMWQWSGGGGTYNGVGDFDQIDASRTP